MKTPWLDYPVAILDIGSITCSHCMLWNKIIRMITTGKDIPVYKYTMENDDWAMKYVTGKSVIGLPLIEVYHNGKLSGTFGGMPTTELRDAFTLACRTDK